MLAEINGDEEITYSEFLLKDKNLPEVAKIIETQNSLFNSKNKLQLAEIESLKQKINFAFIYLVELELAKLQFLILYTIN